jgi:phosphopentomutase
LLKHFLRIVCIVLDGVGVGEAPDAAAYGDSGSNSLANTSRHVGSLRLPVMGRMGLGNITSVDGVPPESNPLACYGKMKPLSPGKDSTTGHWELMGCILERPFPTYPDGFPKEIIAAFEKAIDRDVLGNRPASGTVIIQELGEDHLKTGRPIVYTSQDSVFQIAAHEDLIPVDELYRYCETARAILSDPHNVSRVIARPFRGKRGAFYRTPGRKDFSLPPVGGTVLDALVAKGRLVLAVGKIADLFAGRGITSSIPTKNNREGMNTTLEEIRSGKWDFIFTNLVEFDSMWGHRNDARAYALGLEEFDVYLKTLTAELDEDTLLIITSDHGNDPTTPSTDHSREFVPLLMWHRRMSGGVDLGVRRTYADAGKTVAENFDVEASFPGKSVLRRIE